MKRKLEAEKVVRDMQLKEISQKKEEERRIEKMMEEERRAKAEREALEEK